MEILVGKRRRKKGFIRVFSLENWKFLGNFFGEFGNFFARIHDPPDFKPDLRR